MRRIEVDFFARTMSGLVSLGIEKARRSIGDKPVVDGERVILVDGDFEVLGRVVETPYGMFAMPILGKK